MEQGVGRTARVVNASKCRCERGCSTAVVGAKKNPDADSTQTHIASISSPFWTPDIEHEFGLVVTFCCDQRSTTPAGPQNDPFLYPHQNITQTSSSFHSTPSTSPPNRHCPSSSASLITSRTNETAPPLHLLLPILLPTAPLNIHAPIHAPPGLP